MKTGYRDNVQFRLMTTRASEEIRKGKTRDEYVAYMLALRPRLSREKWTPKLQRAYDFTLNGLNEPAGTCYVCGTEMTHMIYGGSRGDKPFCKDCSRAVSRA